MNELIDSAERRKNTGNYKMKGNRENASKEGAVGAIHRTSRDD